MSQRRNTWARLAVAAIAAAGCKQETGGSAQNPACVGGKCDGESSGGRVLTIVGRGPDHASARERAYAAVAEVGLDGGGYRSDIAAGVEPASA